MADLSLTELERDLLETAEVHRGNGVPIASILFFFDDIDRDVLDENLGRLVDRGFLTTDRGIYVGRPRASDGATLYEEDWWHLTPAGRAAIDQSATPPSPQT